MWIDHLAPCMQALRNVDRFPNKEVTDKDHAAAIYHLADILKEQVVCAVAQHNFNHALKKHFWDFHFRIVRVRGQP